MTKLPPSSSYVSWLIASPLFFSPSQVWYNKCHYSFIFVGALTALFCFALLLLSFFLSFLFFFFSLTRRDIYLCFIQVPLLFHFCRSFLLFFSSSFLFYFFFLTGWEIFFFFTLFFGMIFLFKYTSVIAFFFFWLVVGHFFF